MSQPTTVRLAIPASPPLGPRGVPIHWLKSAGDRIGPNEVLGVLAAATELRAPPSLSGRVERLLAAEGERVINRQPLLRIRITQPDSGGSIDKVEPTRPGALEESPAIPFEEGLPSRIVMEPLDRRTHRTLAVVGGIAVLGIAVAVLCLPVYLIVGGPTVPAVGGLSLMIVAAALAYGQRILRRHDG